MKKIKLADGSGRTAFQLTFQDDYSRGYVFCDLSLKDDLYTTVKGMIAAMRQWQVIPKAVLFDNGSHFRGKLLWTFCWNLGIRIIYSSVHHPQTNGKLQRAFQDDRRDFYRQYDQWLLDHLRYDMPSYVHYRLVSLAAFLDLINYTGKGLRPISMVAEGLIVLARRAKCVIRAAPQVGEFMPVGEPLFHDGLVKHMIGGAK